MSFVPPELRLEGLIRDRALVEGRNDSPHPDLHYFRTSQPSTFQKHQAWAASISVVVQGRKVGRVDGHEYLYEPGRALVVTGPATYETAVVQASPSAPYLALAVRLPTEVVVRTLLSVADVEGPPSGTPAPAFVFDIDQAFADALARLVVWGDDPRDRKLLFPLGLEECVVRILRSEGAATLRGAVRRDPDSQRIVRAMTLIETRLAEALSVADLAGEVGMSPSHFAHRFRAWAKVSPIQYQKQRRLYRARELLVEQGLLVGEAARQVGYSNASTFSREFRVFFQATPGDLVRGLGPQDRHKSPQKPTLARGSNLPTF